MNINFSIKETVSKRCSVRNYSNEKISDDIHQNINTFVSQLTNPFGIKVNFYNLNQDTHLKQSKLGTYGVVKGAKNYVGATTESIPLALEALGYEFETLILYLTHIGMGTCWLGGTFNRKNFGIAMDIDEKTLFPIVSPYGYPAKKKHFTEIAMRKIIKANQRKATDKLFFDTDFRTPLSMEKAGAYANALEMVRLAPSASNIQPWRIVFDKDIWHFFECKTIGDNKWFSHDLQRIDMGIAAAHFDLTLKEEGINGCFEICESVNITSPQNTHYAFSWRRVE